MITKFKIFESDIKNPEVGDYVICYEPEHGKDELNDFLSKNIGKIVEYNPNKMTTQYQVEYENIPPRIDHWFHDIKLNCRPIRRSEIIHCSKNKEDLEAFIQSNKYNL